MPFTWAKISEFFVLHVHCGFLLQGHVGKLVELFLASRSLAECVLALIVFLFKLINMLLKVTIITYVVRGIKSMPHVVEIIFSVVV